MGNECKFKLIKKIPFTPEIKFWFEYMFNITFEIELYEAKLSDKLVIFTDNFEYDTRKDKKSYPIHIIVKNKMLIKFEILTSGSSFQESLKKGIYLLKLPIKEKYIDY